MKSLNIKCVVVGDVTVGKTCMLMSYFGNGFPTEYIPADFNHHSSTDIKMEMDDTNINLRLWDTVEPEDYPWARCLSYPETVIFFIN